MSRNKPVRTNHAYKIDNWVELVVLIFRGVRWLVRQAWRWRTELGYLAVVFALYGWVRHELNKQLATVVVLVALAGLLGWGWSRRLLIGRLWCSATRRRLLSVFSETNVATKAGKLPVVRRSQVTTAGERYALWLRIGQSAELLDSRMEEIRAAARCRDVRVVRDEHRAHLVVIEVLRREPLAGATIDSPLVRYAAGLDAEMGARRAMPTPGGER